MWSKLNVGGHIMVHECYTYTQRHTHARTNEHGHDMYLVTTTDGREIARFNHVRGVREGVICRVDNRRQNADVSMRMCMMMVCVQAPGTWPCAWLVQQEQRAVCPYLVQVNACPLLAVPVCRVGTQCPPQLSRLHQVVLERQQATPTPRHSTTRG